MSFAKDVVRQTQERLNLILESFMNESLLDSSASALPPLVDEAEEVFEVLNNSNTERRRHSYPESNNMGNNPSSLNSSINVDVQLIDTDNTQSPTVVIDLCNIPTTPQFRSRNFVTANNDDDVIFVSSNVIDLSTPTEPIPANRSGERLRELTPLPRIQLPKQKTRRRRTTDASGINSKLQKSASEESDTELHHALKCSVCLENMLQREPTSTKCGHVFCANCIRQALRLTHKCPLCNTKLRPANLTRIYF